MSERYADLRAMSDGDLIAKHDAESVNTVVGVAFYLEELSRCRSERLTERISELLEEGGKQTAEMLELNRQVTDMTAKIGWLTEVAVAAAVFSVILSIYVLLR